MPNEFDIAAADGRHLEAQQSSCCVVGNLHLALLVDHEHAFNHAPEHRLEPRPVARQFTQAHVEGIAGGVDGPRDAAERVAPVLGQTMAGVGCGQCFHGGDQVAHAVVHHGGCHPRRRERRGEGGDDRHSGDTPDDTSRPRHALRVGPGHRQGDERHEERRLQQGEQAEGLDAHGPSA